MEASVWEDVDQIDDTLSPLVEVVDFRHVSK